MHQYHGGYEALNAIHEARRQQVRASALASGLGEHRRTGHAFRRLADWLHISTRHQARAAEGRRASADSLFWA